MTLLRVAESWGNIVVAPFDSVLKIRSSELLYCTVASIFTVI
jgi:hypothetical protein